MAEPDDFVCCLVLPLEQGRALIPAALVADVVACPAVPPPAFADGVPPWILGAFSWRGESHALISLEAATGSRAAAPHPGARVAVLRFGEPGDGGLAVLLQGVPRVLLATAARVRPAANPAGPAYALARVWLDDGEALIPDLQALRDAASEGTAFPASC